MTAISVDVLEQFAKDLLSAAGFSADHAADTANNLTWADARGAASHGVLRIPRYAEMVKAGAINPNASIKTVTSDGAICVLDAGKMPGASAMLAGMAHAVETAARMGIGWCSVRDISHAGAVGYYAMQAANKGMIGLVLSASIPLMAYHGARVSGLSTNPISIAVPKAGDPLLLDMSTSTAALGKIIHARDTGAAIPLDWAIDETGAPTTDAQRVKTLTPLGGPKGSGLSLMIEILASVLVGNPSISTALAGGKGGANGAMLAIDIRRFGDQDSFAGDILHLVDGIKALPRAAGTDEILMPGERGFLKAEASARAGIVLANGTRARLTTLADQLGVLPPDGIRP